jgi:hypothetical protein
LLANPWNQLWLSMSLVVLESESVEFLIINENEVIY